MGTWYVLDVVILILQAIPSREPAVFMSMLGEWPCVYMWHVVWVHGHVVRAGQGRPHPAGHPVPRARRTDEHAKWVANCVYVTVHMWHVVWVHGHVARAGWGHPHPADHHVFRPSGPVSPLYYWVLIHLHSFVLVIEFLYSSWRFIYRYIPSGADSQEAGHHKGHPGHQSLAASVPTCHRQQPQPATGDPTFPYFWVVLLVVLLSMFTYPPYILLTTVKLVINYRFEFDFFFLISSNSQKAKIPIFIRLHHSVLVSWTGLSWNRQLLKRASCMYMLLLICVTDAKS